MENKVSFQYFYGTKADQYSFYRISKALFQNEYFRNIYSDTKALYGLMLNRMSLYIKNQWFDTENRVYSDFSIEDIMELLNCGRNKVIKSLQELESETGISLIEKKRRGAGKANIIYVKSIMMKEVTAKKEETTSETESGSEEKFINQTYEEDDSSQEVYISNPNYTNISYNKPSDNESDLTQYNLRGWEVIL